MKLYYSPQTRSDRPRWALEELGLEHQLVLVNLREGEQRGADFLKINPLGQVPVLVDGEQIVSESGAICLYLADKAGAHVPGLAHRGEYYRWCFYVYATLEPPLLEFFLHSKRLPEAERDPRRVSQARELLTVRLQTVAQAVDGRDFLVGQDFSMADLLVGSALDWAEGMGLLIDFGGLRAYLDRLRARPAFQRSKLIP